MFRNKPFKSNAKWKCIYWIQELTLNLRKLESKVTMWVKLKDNLPILIVKQAEECVLNHYFIIYIFLLTRNSHQTVIQIFNATGTITIQSFSITLKSLILALTKVVVQSYIIVDFLQLESIGLGFYCNNNNVIIILEVWKPCEPNVKLTFCIEQRHLQGRKNIGQQWSGTFKNKALPCFLSFFLSFSSCPHWEKMRDRIVEEAHSVTPTQHYLCWKIYINICNTKQNSTRALVFFLVK